VKNFESDCETKWTFVCDWARHHASDGRPLWQSCREVVGVVEEDEVGRENHEIDLFILQRIFEY
jgi:hypothetical protein